MSLTVWVYLYCFDVVGPQSYRIRLNNAITAITPFKVIQDHWFWYQ